MQKILYFHKTQPHLLYKHISCSYNFSYYVAKFTILGKNIFIRSTQHSEIDKIHDWLINFRSNTFCKQWKMLKIKSHNINIRYFTIHCWCGISFFYHWICLLEMSVLNTIVNILLVMQLFIPDLADYFYNKKSCIDKW